MNDLNEMVKLLEETNAGMLHMTARREDGSIKYLFIVAEGETAEDILKAVDALEEKWEAKE